MKGRLLPLLLAACFPYRELYRPDLHGRVVDERGAPVEGAEVTACSYSRWAARPTDCPRRAQSTTDADGGFGFARVWEWEWCCLGEAPLPQAELYVCQADAGAAFTGESHGWPREEVVLHLGPEASRCARP
ncbi:MAG: carboxypeptidase regulatory-like domain-containing protein [Archangiaceae bacterium]|nr:carboxypeptidase regulatory-like domain-containing protein [Archangiaceae bacterium]